MVVSIKGLRPPPLCKENMFKVNISSEIRIVGQVLNLPYLYLQPFANTSPQYSLVMLDDEKRFAMKIYLTGVRQVVSGTTSC